MIAIKNPVNVMDSFSVLFSLICLGLIGWVAGKEINSIAGKNELVSHREGKCE